MLRLQPFPSLLLVFVGSMDCLTTVIGILYFGAVETNPFMAGMVSTNLPAFVALKLTTTIFVSLIFIQAEKILMQTRDKNSRAFVWTKRILVAAYVGIVAFLVIVVANNVLVLARAM
jgi:hypothetical protein